MYQLDTSAAFYLLPARFWELMVGGLVFFAHRNGWATKVPALPELALAALLTVLFTSWDYQPAATIAAVCISGILLLELGSASLAGRALALQPIVYIGQISYSLYFWHWCLFVLLKWTVGDSLTFKLTLLVLLPLLAACSYHFIESPLRYATWFKAPRMTIAAGFSAACVTVILVNAGLGKLSSGNNQLIARLAGVSAPVSWPKLSCDVNSGELGRFADPFAACLGGERTAEKPNFVYVIGDSHAAQLMLMMDRALAGTPYAARFLQTGKRADYPAAFLKAHAYSVPAVDFIMRNAIAGDFVLTAFHRGLINPHLDKHIPLTQPVVLDSRAQAYAGNMRAWAKELTAKGVGVVLVHDTPLMRVISPVTACALQLSLTGDDLCRVNREQDLHTRKAQDIVFDAIAKAIPGVFTLDPAPAIYAGRSYADVVDREGQYLMIDWNHLSLHGAERLIPVFQSFFQSAQAKHLPDNQKQIMVP